MSNNVINIFENAKSGSFPEAAIAVSMGSPKDISSMIPHLKNLNMQDSHGSTLLMVAAAYDHASICRILLNNGADPSIKNIEGMTALDIAKIEGKEASVAVISQWLPSLKCEEEVALIVASENVISIKPNNPKM